MGARATGSVFLRVEGRARSVCAGADISTSLPGWPHSAVTARNTMVPQTRMAPATTVQN